VRNFCTLGGEIGSVWAVLFKGEVHMKSVFLFLFIVMISLVAKADSMFYYYTQDHRVMALERLYEATKSRYSLWDLKKTNVGIDGDKLFRDALALERTLGDVEGPVAKAKSNIQFHERVKKLIAGFKDTHFGARENSRLPMMVNGIRISPAYIKDKEVPVVTAISKKIMEYNKAIGGAAKYGDIKVGDEVIALDGKPIAEKVAEISQYMDGSSPGFITSAAMRALSGRNYLYGTKNFGEWTLKNEKGKEYKIRLPWYVEKTTRADVDVYLKANNFRRLDRVYYSWDEKMLKWNESKELQWEGFDRFDAPEGLKNVTEWYAGDRLTLRTGYFIKKGKSYGYAQLFSYTSGSLHLKDKKNDKKGRSDDVLRKFIVELKENNTPFIFDLRLNFGGNTGIAIENLSSLAKTGESYPSRTTAFRTSQFMKSMFNTFGRDPSLADQPKFYDFDIVMTEFFHAISIGRKYTNVMLQTKPIVPAEDVGGYDLPVVALISPWCISACDNQAFLLEYSKRVTLIGQPANGTGAGFWGDTAHDPTFVDPLFIISVRIPNYLFGLPVKTDELVLRDHDGSILAQTNSENKPTMPTIEFNYSVDTYKKKSTDWIDKAIEELGKSKKDLM
jgi:C-terminal processing protease CtpA/Prc